MIFRGTLQTASRTKELMPGEKFSPTLWACFQIGDIECVKREIVNQAKSFRRMSAWITVQESPLLCKCIKLSFFYKVDIKPLHIGSEQIAPS